MVLSQVLSSLPFLKSFSLSFQHFVASDLSEIQFLIHESLTFSIFLGVIICLYKRDGIESSGKGTFDIREEISWKP